MLISWYLGANVSKINPYAYIIKSWKPQPNTQKGKIVIDIYENVFTRPKRVFHKIVFVDIQ